MYTNVPCLWVQARTIQWEKRTRKFCDSNFSLASINSTAESCWTEPNRMCYLPEACYVTLSFPLRFCCCITGTKSSDHRSINIVAPEANFATISRRRAFFPAKSTGFWCPESLFSIPEASPSWSVMRAKNDKFLQFRHADLFSGRPRLPPEVVSARLNFSARGPKNLLLHGKNQAGRAPYFWPACQNLRMLCCAQNECRVNVP